MPKKIFTCRGKVKKFPQKGGWVYISTQKTYADLGIRKPKWGLVPATFSTGTTSWKRSLLPMGDGTLFIALNEKVRKAEDIHVGDTIEVTFRMQ